MLSIPHLIIIFVVALVVFGPEKLPELARNIGKVMAEFRRHTSDLRSTFEGHLRELERETDARKIAGPVPVPAAHGTVPSSAPNAPAVAAPTADGGATTEDVPDPDLRRLDPASDPYLMATEFAPEISASRPAAAREPAVAGQPNPSESEKASEKVTDGDVRPA